MVTTDTASSPMSSPRAACARARGGEKHTSENHKFSCLPTARQAVEIDGLEPPSGDRAKGNDDARQGPAPRG